MKKRNPVIGINMDFLPDKNKTGKKALKGIYTSKSLYSEAILENGGIPFLIPCSGKHKSLQNCLDMLDGFLFVGGGDYPPEFYGEKKSSKPIYLIQKRRYDNDIFLASEVMKRKLPALGICAGIQLLNIIAGGKVIQHVESPLPHTHGVTHTVEITSGKILEDLFGKGKTEVNSYHHQAIDPRFVGKNLEITAWSEDGTAEAVESKSGQYILGLQWHPEKMEPDHRNKIFKSFVHACRNHHVS